MVHRPCRARSEWFSIRGAKNQSSKLAESVPLSAEMMEDTHGNFLLCAGAEARVEDVRNAATCRCLRPFDAPIVPNAWAVLREKSLNAGTDSRVKLKLIVTSTRQLLGRTACRPSEFP